MTIYQFLLIGFQLFATFFVFGVASVILNEENDEDDDDQDGGMFIPVGVTN